MKKYNLSQIMKSAHRAYRRENGEISFSDCLKKAWRFAKMQVSVSNIDKACKESIRTKNREFRANRAESTPSKLYNDLNIPQTAYYSGSKGRFSSHFCND